MDSTDVRIFCEMAFRESISDPAEGRHPSAAVIGRKLRLDEKTVRGRMNAMERSGFIKYYQATPSLSLFGMRTVALFRFEALNLTTKYSLIRHLREVPRLVESTDYLGHHVSTNIAGADLEEARREANRLAARFELGVDDLGSRTLHAPSGKLDGLDWKIVRELRYDAKSSDKQLADALSVTLRMVGYRVSKLMSSGAMTLRAVIDPQRQAGLVFYEVELLVEKGKMGDVTRWLEDEYSACLWNITSPTPEILLASMFGFTLGEPEETAVLAMKRGGVKRCDLFLLKEVMEPARPNWIDSLIDLRISA